MAARILELLRQVLPSFRRSLLLVRGSWDGSSWSWFLRGSTSWRSSCRLHPRSHAFPRAEDVGCALRIKDGESVYVTALQTLEQLLQSPPALHGQSPCKHGPGTRTTFRDLRMLLSREVGHHVVSALFGSPTLSSPLSFASIASRTLSCSTPS